MKSTESLISTTLVPNSGSHVEYFTDFFFENQVYYKGILEILVQVYDIAVFVNLFVNLPHLFILTRKELRSNLVYIIMIGICLCDLIHSFGKISQIFMTLQIAYSKEKCTGAFPWYHIMVDIYAKCTQIMSRRCSGFFSLFIAGFRAFSVTNPMSDVVTYLGKPKTGWWIVLIMMVICGAWSSSYFFTTKFTKLTMCPVGKTPSWVMYTHETNLEAELSLRMYDGFIAIIVCVLHVLVAIALIIAISKAKKMSKNLKSEKSSNTSFLVIVMTGFMFFSEMVYGAIFIFNFLVLRKYEEKVFFQELEVVALTLSIVNSIAHCFVCFFMSSQYRDVVKKLICCGKKEPLKVTSLNSLSVGPTTTLETTRTFDNPRRNFQRKIDNY